MVVWGWGRTVGRIGENVEENVIGEIDNLAFERE